MRNRIITLLMVVLLVCSNALTVYAHEVPDLTQKGSIEITMHIGDVVVPGGSLTLYRVGQIQEDNGNYSFGFVTEFADCGQSLDNIQSSELAARLAEYAANLQGTTKEIDRNGNIIFPDLELGLYLLVQNEAAAGYNRANPFLVSVPENENGKYIYQVVATPKVELSQGTIPPETTPPASGQPATGEPSDTPTDAPDNPPPTDTSLTNSDTSIKSTPEPDPTLPQTGQLNWPVPFFAVLGLWMFTIGWILRFGRRKQIDEK